jgi:Putative cell wall-binding domain
MKKSRKFNISRLSILSTIAVSMLLSNKAYAASPTIHRLDGLNRYETNLSIIDNGWTEASTVIIASGEAFPDALCAAPLAKANNAPILLTEKDGLNNATIDKLTKLKVKNAYIVGGAGVISTAVETQLNNLDITCTRLAGSNRYETSVKVAETLGTDNGIVVASGENFPDALSIAPIAANMGMPILLSTKDTLPNTVNTYINSKDTPVSYVVGGLGSLSDNIKMSLKNSKRLSGINRYKTNLNIIREFENTLNFNSIYVASGSNFPDALSGSVLAANLNSPIILTDSTLPTDTSDYLKEQNSERISLLGGTGAINKDIENSLQSAVKYSSITRVDDISDYVFVSHNYSFPTRVLAAYEDGTTRLVPVTWNSNVIDTSKTSTYNFEGTLAGYKNKVKLTVKVTLENGNVQGNPTLNTFLVYYKDNIYYTGLEGRTGLSKIGSSNAEPARVVNGDIGYLSIVNDWIYFTTGADDNNLYKCKLDGSEQTKLTTEGFSPFLVVDQWIYASNRKNEFYKMKTDGSNKVILGNEFAYNMLIDDNYLYYQNKSDGDSVYKMDITTNNKVKVINDKVSAMNILDGWIYYSNFNDGKKLYKIKTDGTGNAKLSEDSINYLTVYNGWIYYSNDSDNQKLYRIRTDGTDKVKFVDEGCYRIAGLGDYIIYSTTVSPFIGKIAQLDGRVGGRFAIPDVFEKEPNNSIESALAFPLGGGWNSPEDNSPAVYGSLQSNDSDFYKVDLNEELNFHLLFNSSDILSNAVISIMNKDGKVIYSTKTESDGTAGLSIKLAAGTYYIKVSALDGSTIESGNYKIDGWSTPSWTTF